MSDDIVERLRAHLASDHKRGCGGRFYSCDCGYDNSTEGLLAKAADEIERLTECFRSKRWKTIIVTSEKGTR